MTKILSLQEYLERMIKETINETEKVDFYERLIRLKEELSDNKNKKRESEREKVTTMGCPKNI